MGFLSSLLRPAKCDAPAAGAPGGPPPAAAVAAALKPKVDWMELPLPVKYEELAREAHMSLKPEYFEGCRFDFTKQLNQKFLLQHSVFMGTVAEQHPMMPGMPEPENITKVPAATYEFTATLLESNLTMFGRMLTDGRLSGRAKYDVNDALNFMLHTQLSNDAGDSNVMVDMNTKGLDWQGQLKVGSHAFIGLNYMQSVSPNLALGCEAFSVAGQRSGVGFAGRYNSDQCIATAQVATSGVLHSTYVQRLNEKACLATDFLWHWNAGEAQASIGYDYIFRTCRLRGKVDSHGVVGLFLEERLDVGFTLLVSGEIDHVKKDYRFGIGLTLGE